MAELKRPFILFDSECPMCKRFKQGLQLIDTQNQIHFYDARDKELYEHIEVLDYEECLDKVHLLTENEEVLVGAEVIDYLIKILPGVSRLSWLLDYDVSQKALNVFYNTVDKIRKNTVICDKCNKDK
jgi:predicted DCC family thiol-disulfide oxidoreductase YuxK